MAEATTVVTFALDVTVLFCKLPCIGQFLMMKTIMFYLVILSVIIFKAVSLVIKRVLVVKALASQGSLLRKLLKEATRKLLEEAS